MTPTERIAYFETQTKLGFEVLEPKRNELLLDLDWPVYMGSYEHNVKELKKRVARLHVIEPIDAVYIKPSLVHFHGRVVMKEAISFLERQMYEMMLGSDPCRAIHNLRHYRDSGPYPELLCTNKGPWTEIRWVPKDGE